MKYILHHLALGILFFLSSSAAAQQSSPTFNSGDLNVVFVQSFESNPDTNNLSITGFNHSLLFGQMLNALTTGQTIQGIYAFYPPSQSPKGTPPAPTTTDMTALESIEPYAVLNMLSVSPQAASLADLVATITTIIDKPTGVYVISLPASHINPAIFALTGQTPPSGSIPPGNGSQYSVVTFSNKTWSLNVYNDGISAPSTYPNLTLAPTANYSCLQAPTTIFIANPNNSNTFNTNQTVYFVRHVEAHPTSTFENGNYVCQGQWRAIGATQILKNPLMSGGINNIFTTNLTGKVESPAASSLFPYIRPALSVAPYAINNSQPLILAPFAWNDPDALATSLFTQSAQYASFNNATTLVSWEHGNIEAAIRYLIKTLYNDDASSKKVPTWSGSDYDTVWKLQTDGSGNLIFSNTCEGIASAVLPSACPAFPITGN